MVFFEGYVEKNRVFNIFRLYIINASFRGFAYSCWNRWATNTQCKKGPSECDFVRVDLGNLCYYPPSKQR